MRVSILSLSLLASSLALAFPALGNSSDCQETVLFPLTLTWEKGAPDGFERDMILMNGQFPGPTLEMKEGANVEVGRPAMKRCPKNMLTTTVHCNQQTTLRNDYTFPWH
jgi:FtsP/CotA-like multicopper oxidase with cupredoxin domain